MNLISIIIPYYRKKNYIKSAIRSIYNQNYKRFEIIIIYDDYDRKDLVYIKELKKKYKKINIIVNKQNVGAGYSRNKGIAKSKGKYVAFLDADDLWKPSKLRTQLNFMLKKKIFLSHTSYEIINSNNQIISTRIATKLSHSDLLKSCDIGLSTVMVKKSILPKKLFPKNKTKEDYILWLKLTKKGNNFYPIKKKLSIWRQTENSLSSSTIQKLKDAYYVYRFFLKQNLIQTILSTIILSLNYLKKK